MSPSGENFKRAIPLLGSAALALNGMIGAGIFALPGVVAARMGSYSPILFVVCALMMLPVFLSVGAVASRFDATGGPVAYTRVAFGPFVSFVAGWLFYLGGIAAMSANTNALVNYLGMYWEWVGSGYGRWLVIGLICLVLTYVNVVGVRNGLGAIYLFTALKLAPLALLVLVGFTSLKMHPLNASPMPTTGSISDILILVVYAFVGFESALVPAGEGKNPKRDIPRALLLILGTTTALYVVIQFVCVAALSDAANAGKAPLADAARILMGAPGAVLLTAAAAFSIAGNLSGSMLAWPRLTYSMAKQGSLPAIFGEVHAKTKTPIWSIVFLGLLVFVLASSGTFMWLAKTASLAKLIGYALCILCLWRLDTAASGARAAAGLGVKVLGCLGLLTCTFLISRADASAWWLLGAFLLTGFTVYFLVRRRARAALAG